MDKKELIEKLEQLNIGDPEFSHCEADDLLLKFIDDDKVTKAFNAIEKWYA
jgi:hypothetical protein